MEHKYNRLYYYNLMTKDMKEEWMVEFKKLNKSISLKQFFSEPVDNFRAFIASSFPWAMTEKRHNWWLNYAISDKATILSWQRENKISELGI